MGLLGDLLVFCCERLSWGLQKKSPKQRSLYQDRGPHDTPWCLAAEQISSTHYWHVDTYYIDPICMMHRICVFSPRLSSKRYILFVLSFSSQIHMKWRCHTFTLMRRQNSFDHISIYSKHNVLSLCFHLVSCFSRNLMKWTQHNMNHSTIQIWTVNIILVPC